MLMAGEVAAAHLAFEGLMAGVEMEKAEMLATSPAANSAHIKYSWQWNGIRTLREDEELNKHLNRQHLLISSSSRNVSTYSWLT